MGRLYLFIERACAIFGFLVAAATLYFTAGAYYGWNQSGISPSVSAETITMNAPWWIVISGVIAVLLLITAWVTIVIRIEWLRVASRATEPFLKWPDPYHPILVSGRIFQNEKVPLDGYYYSNCDFHNITFVYNGTTPIRLNNNHVFGDLNFSTNNLAISGMVTLLRGLDALKPDINMEMPYENGYRKYGI